MISNSTIFKLFLKIYSSVVNLIQQSMFWQLLSKLNDKFNLKIKSSAVVCAFSSKDKLDEGYRRTNRNTKTIIASFFGKMLSTIRVIVDKSYIFSHISDLCDDALDIPLIFPGITLAVWGLASLIGAYVKDAGTNALILSGFILIIGILFMMVKHSVNMVLNNSFVFSNLFKIINITITEKTPNCTFKYATFGVVGIILGVITVVFDFISVLIALFCVAAVVLFFRYTTLMAWIYVCVLPFMPTMLMVLFGLALFFSVVVKCCLGYKKNLYADKYAFNMLLLFMGISFAIAAAFSFARTSSVKIALVYIAFLCAVYALVKLFSTKKVVISVLNGISVLSLPVSLLGIYQHFTGFDEQNTWIDTEMFDEISGRVVSFFGNPNVFGEYLILAILTSAICFFVSKKIYFKTLHLSAVALSGEALIFTYSRGCWIGLIFAAAIFLFMNKRKMFVAFCVLGIASVFFLPDSIISRIASVGNLADSSTSYRVYIWEGTINMLKDFWITGIGLGSDAFNSVYPLYAYSAITAPHPHNLYLVILTETGIVGALAFAIIILFYYKRLFSIIRFSKDSTLRTIASGLIAAISGFLLQGMFDNVWYNYRVFLLFWIYVAIGLAVDVAARRSLNEKN